MARVLLIGAGPLPHPTAKRLGFPQLRLGRFRDALATEHSVRVVCLGSEQGGSSEEDGFSGIHSVDPDSRGWLERLRRLAEPADTIVSAGPYLPGEAACLIAEDRPVWADLPGDPFAELQAVALAEGIQLSTARVAAARSAALAVLSRADRISVISERQRLALTGQLGVLGRLLPGAPPQGVGVVVPISYQLGLARGLPRRRRPGSPMVVALCGGFNTWLDDRGIAMALQRALDEAPGLSVVVTGGAIAGHYAAGFERFDAWRRKTPHRSRIVLRGWVQHEALTPILSAAHVGLYLDRPGCEALLGSRTRVHLFSWAGLEVVGSPDSDLTHQMATAGLLHPAPTDPRETGALLARLYRDGSDGKMAARANAWLTQQFHPDRVLRPLRQWAQQPERAPPAPHFDAVLEENARLRQALRDIHQSPTWRALSVLHRAGRRVLGDPEPDPEP